MSKKKPNGPPSAAQARAKAAPKRMAKLVPLEDSGPVFGAGDAVRILKTGQQPAVRGTVVKVNGPVITVRSGGYEARYREHQLVKV